MAKRTWSLVATALVLLCAPGQVAAAPAEPQVQDALDRMVEQGVPGVLYRHSEPGSETVLRSGVADLRTGAPVPQRGRWRVASLTKSVTATIVLQLVHENRLGLDQPLAEVLPDVVPGDERITVRNLLQHNSGLFDYAQAPEFRFPDDYVHRPFAPRQLVDLAIAHGPVAEPGQQWSYSNTNYIVLGMIVEELTGEPLSAVFQHRVLGPAGMRQSYLPVHYPLINGPHATGHHVLPEQTGDPTRYPLTELDPSFAWASYGMVSGAADMNRFYRTLFRGELLPRPLVDEMLRAVPGGDPVFPDYGLGLENIELTCGVTLWGHTGSIPGYSSYAFSTADGRQQVSMSLNVFMLGERAVPIIYDAADAINQAVCHQPYPQPPVPAA